MVHCPTPLGVVEDEWSAMTALFRKNRISLVPEVSPLRAAVILILPYVEIDPAGIVRVATVTAPTYGSEPVTADPAGTVCATGLVNVNVFASITFNPAYHPSGMAALPGQKILYPFFVVGKPCPVAVTVTVLPDCPYVAPATSDPMTLGEKSWNSMEYGIDNIEPSGRIRRAPSAPANLARRCLKISVIRIGMAYTQSLSPVSTPPVYVYVFVRVVPNSVHCSDVSTPFV